ncbi:unnamed protein product [Trichobilharzia szidati]|nr:unnamed protein product [Trichobilharzia szidati]
MVESENLADRKYYIDFVPTNSAQAIQKAVSNLYCCEDIVIKGRLGNGYFASVFLVNHRPTKRLMAMKLTNEASFHRREIELLGSLNHINVLRLYGSCLIGARFVCLTEYANGGSLADLLAAKAIDLSWPVRINLALDIAYGLHHLRSHNLIHRDLTSQNILIRVQPRIYPDTVDNGFNSTSNRDRDSFHERSTQTKQSISECDIHTKGDTHKNGVSQHRHNLHNPYYRQQQLQGYNRVHQDSETDEFLLSNSYLDLLNSDSDATTVDEFGLNLAHLLSFISNHSREISCTNKLSIPINCLQAMPLIEPQWKQLISSSDLCLLKCLNRSEVLTSNSPFTFTALVADLGLCLDLSQDHVDAVSVVGNPFYTAPECLNRVAPYTFAADIFSYGLLVCELITRFPNDCSLIPRKSSFGLDHENLPIPSDCPIWLFQLAVDCCSVDHLLRPDILDVIDRIEKCRLNVSCHSTTIHSPSPVPVQNSVTTNGSYDIASQEIVHESAT